MSTSTLHRTGVEAMGLLVVGHLTGAGAAVRRKVEGATAAPAVVGKKRGAAQSSSAGVGGASSTTRAMTAAERAEETAARTRDRLTEALLNRDLMKSRRSTCRCRRGWCGAARDIPSASGGWRPTARPRPVVVVVAVVFSVFPA
ncbi:hypothetical protein ACHAW5_001283 [Stephanodiscus triporus]|uniref:Uncharacterized protein n=1 Tax=Stephanodiscus triporus TaxID=2934178 RepID=A0ABD3N0T5_9STRA